MSSPNNRLSASNFKTTIDRESSRSTAGVLYHSRMLYLTEDNPSINLYPSSPRGSPSPTKKSTRNLLKHHVFAVKELSDAEIAHQKRRNPCSEKVLVPPLELMTRGQALRFMYLKDHKGDVCSGVKKLESLKKKVDASEVKKREAILRSMRDNEMVRAEEERKRGDGAGSDSDGDSDSEDDDADTNDPDTPQSQQPATPTSSQQAFQPINKHFHHHSHHKKKPNNNLTANNGNADSLSDDPFALAAESLTGKNSLNSPGSHESDGDLRERIYRNSFEYGKSIDESGWVESGVISSSPNPNAKAKMKTMEDKGIKFDAGEDDDDYDDDNEGNETFGNVFSFMSDWKNELEKDGKANYKKKW